MDVTIVGNGILALTTAYRLLARDRDVRLAVVGPADHRGCASLAAAAMFNSFCEVEAGTLGNEIERQKFLFNKSANPYWPAFLADVERDAHAELEYGFGTFLINNHATDSLEDENFDAVVAALAAFGEPHELVRPASIPHYKPGPRERAGRAVFIPREGWVNPVRLIAALKAVLADSGRVRFVNGYCDRVECHAGRARAVALRGGERVGGDWFFLAPGATFSEIVRTSDLGLPMPKIFYGVGCTVLLKTGETTLTNCIRTPNRGLACGVYAAPQGGGHTIVGASNFISPVPEDHVRVTSVYTLLKSAMEQINSDYYRSQLVKVNVGWRPTSEDTLPLLGRTSVPNLLVATGTKRDGLHCSPVISEYISDLILRNGSAHDLGLFAPERKPVRVYTRAEAIRTAVRHTLNAAYQHGFEPAKNRMVEDLERHYTAEFEALHDAVGAADWGIPVEMINMYKYGHVQ